MLDLSEKKQYLEIRVEVHKKVLININASLNQDKSLSFYAF